MYACVRACVMLWASSAEIKRRPIIICHDDNCTIYMGRMTPQKFLG